MQINGVCDARFTPVRDAFAENFTRCGEIGAACCVYYRSRPVVDLWAGVADLATGRAWTEDTAVIVFSATKGATAICANLLVERGALDLDTPIDHYWPEFAARGKGHIPVRWALCHKAGLAAVDGDLTLEQVLAWNPVAAAIAAQAPNWEPGSAHGYHARSYGWILGELVRRITGRTLGRFFADEIAAPLSLDFWIGLPAAEEPRVATIVPPVPPADPAVRELLDKFMGPDTLLGRVLSGPSNLFHYDDMWNRRALRAAEMPSSNGIATARAIARMYAALLGEVDGVQLLRPETVQRARQIESSGPEKVLMLPTAFGLGFMLPPTLSPPASAACFGHPGAGGSLGLADPEAGFALGYVMNRMDLGLTGDPRAHGLVAAVYASLAS